MQRAHRFIVSQVQNAPEPQDKNLQVWWIGSFSKLELINANEPIGEESCVSAVFNYRMNK